MPGRGKNRSQESAHGARIFSVDSARMLDHELDAALDPETEARLKELATLKGRSPEELALEALQEKLAVESEPGDLLSPEEWLQRFDAWVSRHKSRNRRLGQFRAWLASKPGGNQDADFSRESIYGNRGE